MTLGEILQQAALKDLVWKGENGISYLEIRKDGKFEIKLSSSKEKEAYIECSCPDNGSEQEENYLRLHFLSMAFNAAIYGMRRLKSKKVKK